jgi:hypothetical protein
LKTLRCHRLGDRLRTFATQTCYTIATMIRGQATVIPRENSRAPATQTIYTNGPTSCGEPVGSTIGGECRHRCCRLWESGKSGGRWDGHGSDFVRLRCRIGSEAADPVGARSTMLAPGIMAMRRI